MATKEKAKKKQANSKKKSGQEGGTNEKSD